MNDLVFSTPPGWPQPPPGWAPPTGWTPNPAWPPAPPGWVFWQPTGPPAGSIRNGGDENDADAGESTVATNPGDAVSAELAVLQTDLAHARRDLAETRNKLELAREDLIELDDTVALQRAGIYQYHHPLENAEAYRQEFTKLQSAMKDAVRKGEAVLASTMFSYNNSLAAGRKMTSDFSKLMLRAYNAEADNGLRSLRAGNVASAKKRLENAAGTIARLGAMMEMRIAPIYHGIRLREIELTADYLMKVQEEREIARDERDRMREERRAEQEIARERERLDKERAHYLNALQTLAAQGKEGEADDLHSRLSEIDAAIEHNEFRAANIRAGTVYVISNIGAFGGSVVKIGMTRRLDPFERVRELGDASVPFPYDVHAVFFSKDAVTLENELHKAFADRRVNQVNIRREFFFATPTEVRAALAEKVGNLLEFTEKPEATQYFQSRAQWPETGRS
jgi:hypothetical protein